MSLKFNESEDGRRVMFEGSMIYKNSRATERFILDMVCRHRHLKVDLSEVKEIDRCGVHLLAMIKSFGSEFIEIVATSPVIDVALAHIPLSRRKQHLVHGKSMPPTINVHPNPVALSV